MLENSSATTSSLLFQDVRNKLFCRDKSLSLPLYLSDILLQEISEFVWFWVYRIYITRSLSVWIILANILRRNAKENFLCR